MYCDLTNMELTPSLQGEEFLHYSTRLFFREPQGAQPCGTSVRLRALLSASSGAVTVRLRIWDGAERFLDMAEDGTLENGARIFTLQLELPKKPGILWYSFLLIYGDGSVHYYGGDSGRGYFRSDHYCSWRITVYDGAFTTPAWFRRSLVYQIFPDRFNRSSLQAFKERAKVHTDLGRTVRIHEDWNEEPHWTAQPGEKDYSPRDFFGGDLAGILEKLPYLKDLGVTCLYLNPIFEADSNHRYNTADYHSVDPILGTREDLHLLAEKAREYGMRIMLDGVFSHTGSDSRYFNMEGRYKEPGAYQGKASPYYNWYRFEEFPDKYECWWGFETLPNVEELNEDYSDFIAGPEGVLSDYAKNDGITSWRLDVADELPDDFIRILRKRIKENDPEGVILGEVWEECSNKCGPEGRRAYVDGDLLDSAMDYPFACAVVDYLTGRDTAPHAQYRFEALREWYPEPFYLAQLNLLSSHDECRVWSRLCDCPPRNAPREEQVAFNPDEELVALGRKRFLQATAMQMVMPGVPCIYYGDEAGMMGGGDPFNRRTYPWGREDQDLRSKVRDLSRLRAENEALKSGRCRMGNLGRQCLGIVRYTGEDCVILLVNNGDEDIPVRFDNTAFIDGPDGREPMPLKGNFRDETGAEQGPVESTTIRVPAHGYVIRVK